MAHTSRRIVESYLVSSARLGSRDAKAQLVDLYQTRFLRHAYRLLGDVEQAKDAVQDGWLEIIRGLAGLRDDMAFSAWAFRIISRCCAQSIDRQVKTRLIRDRLASEPVVEIDKGNPLETAAEQGPLRKAFESLLLAAKR